ncbi:MAG: D-alanyl-D-alanine carboxypeptidase [Holosporales bacterium]|jgi:D-alanyl-D-alanine carboxypeptidase (penicillin-binding protein 5/6)|nr:D-alanyl-D-alanine carboxypeptidase [Holosporales bacterium]
MTKLENFIKGILVTGLLGGGTELHAAELHASAPPKTSLQAGSAGSNEQGSTGNSTSSASKKKQTNTSSKPNAAAAATTVAAAAAAAQDASSTKSGTSTYHVLCPKTAAKQAYLIDADSKAVLFEFNAHERMSPSSMTKIVTACIVGNKLKDKEITMDTTTTVSSQAYRKEGSTMFLNIGQTVSVRDLLSGLIIVSGNDAAVALAECACGSEAVFASYMNAWAHECGATSSNFVNASGLPDPTHKTTASDLAIMSLRAISDYPDIFSLYSQKSFTFNGVTQQTKNEILRRDIGCDGLKTGHTNDGGYGIVATIKQDNRRLVLVVNGYKSEQDRIYDACALLTWGTKTFVNHHLYKSHSPITTIPVWYGEDSELPVTVENDVVITLLRTAPYDVKIVLRYETPIAAPIQKGTQVGEIIISSQSMDNEVIVPLIASVSVKEGSFFKKLMDSSVYLVWGARKPKSVGAGN